MAISPITLAAELLAIIERDHVRLERIDNYIRGIQDEPYMPASADAEYRLLAKRAISNWMPLIIGAPAQAMFIDGVRPSRAGAAENLTDLPEWKHWQYSGLDARQLPITRSCLGYGHAFTLTEKVKNGKVKTKGLSPLRTAALFEDAANDVDPYAALTVTKWAVGPDADSKGGKARLWDQKNEYIVTFDSLTDAKSIQVKLVGKHGLKECPVTRFAACIDLEGRTTGVVEPMIPLQNRINQTVFDLLVTQTYASFKVRWVTGMAPPMQMRMVDEDGNETTNPDLAADIVPRVDENGAPVPKPIDHNAKRFLFAEDPNTKFGSLDESPLDGFISSIDMSVRHLAAVSQTPPHYLLGQIANLSAEALTAAETALSRKIAEFRVALGESWERVFRLAGALMGEADVADDYGMEVLWRDMEQKSLAQAADALGKLADQLDIPKQGLWHRVPDVTQTEIKAWKELQHTQDYQRQIAEAMTRASQPFGGDQGAPPPHSSSGGPVNGVARTL